MAERGTRAEIDLNELEKLCMLHCSNQELADWFRVSLRTIERRQHEPDFGAIMQRGRSMGKMSVRRAQMRLLEAGNCVMAIWLGKQLLGQSDQVSHDVYSQTDILLQVLTLPKCWDVDPNWDGPRGLPGVVTASPDADSDTREEAEPPVSINSE